ncbi:MAG: DUF1329 domain-containing protein [Candidatus Pelagadaptatus aseana]|uniref:DUF1329 domain-containing protein n=1 Tax=Candidatus Pelagadaptatus aseana TaxID=3120508 RepID=UPI0039B26BDF
MLKIISLLRWPLLLVISHGLNAAVSEQQAEQLGSTLTPLGAETSGNASGTIPAWSPNVELSSSDPIYITNPLNDEQALFDITRDNMDDYSALLSQGSKALLQDKEDYRMSVYPTLRTAVAPQFIYDNTRHNATHTRLTNDGLTLENWQPGVPFPIPQNGLEAIWNHLTRWSGSHSEYTSTVYFSSSNGKVIQSSTQFISFASPVYSPDRDWGKGANELFLLRANFLAPPRRAGEIILVREPYDFSKAQGRKAWQYLTGQRRVRMAPSIAFDTPAPASSGNNTYDDSNIFNGSPERFDWQLVGKQECLTPYNNWRTTNVDKPKALITPGHFNPDAVRWEIHRCWVVEATLKEGLRHVYSKRRYYIDEDSWVALMGDLYDNRGNLWRTNFALFAPNYMDKSFASSGGIAMYDLLQKSYHVSLPHAMTTTSRKKPKKSRYYTASSLKRSGVR